jgi:hypothetical protein
MHVASTVSLAIQLVYTVASPTSPATAAQLALCYITPSQGILRYPSAPLPDQKNNITAYRREHLYPNNQDHDL